MTLRKKIFFIVAYVVEVMMIGLYVGISFFFLGSLIENETKNVEQSVGWVGRAIRQDIAIMDRQLLDWSQWDDMYAFADVPTEEFVASNLPVDSLKILNVNFIVIADREGKVLAAEGMDTKTNERISVPDEVLRQFRPGNILVNFDSTTNFHAGLISFSSGPAFIATRPIVTSRGEGPSRGTVAFVRMISGDYYRELENFLGYPIEFAPFGSKEFSSNFSEVASLLSSPDDIRTDVGESSISGYGFIPDVFDGQALFYKVGKIIPTSFGTSKLVAGLSLLGFFLGATLIIFFLLHWTVLSRVNFLSQTLALARKNGLSKDGIEFGGSDEIAQLAKEINALLSALLRSQEKSDVAERRFETISDTIPALLWMIGRDRQCLYINKRVQSLLGEVPKERFMEEWEKHIHPDDVEECLLHCADAFESRKPLSMEYRVSSVDGRVSWMLDNSVPYSSSSGVFLGFLHVAIDITDRKESEGMEITKRKEAERLNAIMVSRELRMIELKNEIKELREKKEVHS